MPDILIRGVEMPKTCAICKIRSCNSYCPLNIEIKFFFDPSNTGFDFCTGRHSDCPLHELPEHGDLIDRDALLADGWMDLHKTVVHMGGCAVHDLPLKNPTIPVIIPASGEVTNDYQP